MNSFKIRIDQNNPRHTHFTVFCNGANCGQLHMESVEAFAFISTLAKGACKELGTEVDIEKLRREENEGQLSSDGDSSARCDDAEDASADRGGGADVAKATAPE